MSNILKLLSSLVNILKKKDKIETFNVKKKKKNEEKKCVLIKIP